MPVSGDGPIEGTIKLSKVDAAELSEHASNQRSMKLTGHADGQGHFRYSARVVGRKGRQRPSRGLPLEAEGHLTAPDLKVGGVPARSVKLTLTVHEGNPRFDLPAEGLGGTFRLTGDGHLATDPKDDEMHATGRGAGPAALRALGRAGDRRAARRPAGPGVGQGPGASSAVGWTCRTPVGEGSVELDQLIWGFD